MDTTPAASMVPRRAPETAEQRAARLHDLFELHRDLRDGMTERLFKSRFSSLAMNSALHALKRALEEEVLGEVCTDCGHDIGADATSRCGLCWEPEEPPEREPEWIQARNA